VERFGQIMREKLTTGEVPFRKAYLGSIVDRVEVDDREIRIVGRKDVLEQAVLANGGPIPGVRSFVRKWRSLGESNPSFQIEKRSQSELLQCVRQSQRAKPALTKSTACQAAAKQHRPETRRALT
jgi:hypothetical protein